VVSENIWKCKIGGAVDALPLGADFPMRQAIRAAYREITGKEPDFLFSGWGAQLTEDERTVVEDRLPCKAKQMKLEYQHQDCDYSADDGRRPWGKGNELGGVYEITDLDLKGYHICGWAGGAHARW
jgi:hypothetical protein